MFGGEYGCLCFRFAVGYHVRLDEFHGVDAVMVDHGLEIRLRCNGLYCARLSNRDDVTCPLLLENPLDALDRKTLIVEEVPDALEQLHIVGAIVSPPATPLERLDLREPRFPETQHVLW